MRRAAGGVALVFFVNGVILGSWIPRLPEIRDRLGVDLDTLGLTLALGGLGSLAGSSVSGLVVARLGAKRSAILSSIVLLAFLPLLAVVPSAILLALVLATMGFLDGQTDVGMNAAGVRVEEAAGRSIITRLHGLWSLGTLVGSGLSALALLVGLELGPHLLLLSIAGMVAVMAASPMIPDAPPRVRIGGRRGALALGLVLAGATTVIVEGVPFEWSAFLLTDVTGATGAVAGAGVILFTGGMLVGRLTGDFLVDRYRAVPTLFTGLGVAVMSMLVVVTTRSSPPALVAFAFWGVGISVALPVLYKLAGSHTSFGEGAGLAALTVGTRLGFIVSPAVIGVLAASWSLQGALGLVVGVASVASALTIGLTLASPKPARDSTRDLGAP